MRHEEEDTQIQCVEWMRWQHPKEAQSLHHSPNGGKRALREAARFKAMGTSAGFPDLLLSIARGGWHGLAVEMKAQKGVQSAAQRQWQQRLEENGYRYEVCRSLDQFRVVIKGYLGG